MLPALANKENPYSWQLTTQSGLLHTAGCVANLVCGSKTAEHTFPGKLDSLTACQ
jgi:hypothetical protein